jgi:putative ABC transport system ATP-binding protein
MNLRTLFRSNDNDNDGAARAVMANDVAAAAETRVRSGSAAVSANEASIAATNGDVIRMENISKIYDTGRIKVEALRGVSLRIEQGEFVAIVGPSGSGKSTLMNLIGCLDTPTGGTYRLRGRSVSGLNRDELAEIRNRRIGFVFQNFNLMPQISTYENVEMPMLFGGVGRRERRRRVTEVLEKVGLGDRMEHKPTEISGGQMQRVAVARALAMEPDILLADEPTGNLDTTSGNDILDLFEELWRQGRTMIVITHDQALARRASRIVEIRDGAITSDRPGEAAE